MKDARTEVVCKSMTQSTEKESRTIVVLDRKGLEAAHFVCGCDMFRSLQKFSGEILNASGQSVRKIKRSELQKSEYSSSLSTDDYFYYYECNFPSFPFTVKYEWEMKCVNGLIGYMSFIPQTTFQQGVEKASYRIELPAEQACRYRELNTEGKDIQVKESTGAAGQRVIEATATKLPPVEQEPFGPTFAELFPRVYFAPSAFIYEKSKGDMSTWQTYGAWQYELLNGRDVLTEPFRNKLRELTANCSTDREKVKAIYDYLAQTTRYVSIQLGIGGCNPFPHRTSAVPDSAIARDCPTTPVPCSKRSAYHPPIRSSAQPTSDSCPTIRVPTRWTTSFCKSPSRKIRSGWNAPTHRFPSVYPSGHRGT
nr:DUF3857 domain-containing protein [Bacteroides reticulotermitis]